MWYQCKSCGADLRSCRHTNLCIIAPESMHAEIQRVRAVIITTTAVNGLMVIKGGKAYQEAEGQDSDS